MNTVIRLAFVIIFMLLVAGDSTAREWRGITPLRSTRADVVRLFNQCLEQREACLFRLNQEEVYLVFSGGLGKHYVACAQSLPSETVMFIQVKPLADLTLKRLRRSEKKLELMPPSYITGPSVKTYRASNGFLVSTGNGYVLQFVYLPETYNERPCADYYAAPEPFVQTFAIHPPVVIHLECPSRHSANADLVLTGRATVATRRGPTWTVSAGKIKSGQHTHTLIIDTTGLAGQSIIVSAELADGFGHAVATTCKVAIGDQDP